MLILNWKTIELALSAINDYGMPSFKFKPRGKHGVDSPEYKIRRDHLAQFIGGIKKAKVIIVELQPKSFTFIAP